MEHSVRILNWAGADFMQAAAVYRLGLREPPLQQSALQPREPDRSGKSDNSPQPKVWRLG